MTKKNFVFAIITEWAERNKINLAYEQTDELANEICKELKLRKRRTIEK